MIDKSFFGSCGLALLGLLACSSGDGEAPAGAGPEPDAFGEAGLHRENDSVVFRTEPFTVPAGKEDYLCWTVKTAEALKVNAFGVAGKKMVHHFLFAQTTAPEPEGFSKCETLFKTTWLPLFSAGAGENELNLPSGIAHELAPDTQLLVQLHLLNTSEADITDATEIRMGITEEPDTEPVHIGGFGSFQIALPPLQKSSITHECTLPEGSRMVALMPHMHRTATSLALELGTNADDLQVIYSRDDWDFDQQTVDNFDLTITPGQHARITCNYDNKTDRTITYGESTLDEMCFLGAFWVGNPMNCIAF